MSTSLMLRVWIFAGVALVETPQLRGQQLPSATDSTNFVASDRSPTAAVVLEWALPTVGYAYAGNWTRGIPSALVRLAGLATFLDDQFTIFGSPPPCESQCLVGLGIATAGTVWAMFDAARTTTRENDRRRAAATGVSVTTSVGRRHVGVGLRVPTRW